MRTRIFALPNEHGAWALWLGPFLAGWGAAGRTGPPLVWTFLAILFVFMARHPMTLLVRALSGRRRREDARPAALWTSIYLTTAAAWAGVLIAQGFARLLLLALPAIPLLFRQMMLVARKEERRMGIELAGAGVLALAAPAAHIAATGQWSLTALMLWLLLWLYAAVSVVYVHMRLAQRRLAEVPDPSERIAIGSTAMRAAAAALVVAALGALTRQVPPLTPLPFILLQLQVISGTLRPAIGYKVKRVGFSQVGATVAFVALIVFSYRV